MANDNLWSLEPAELFRRLSAALKQRQRRKLTACREAIDQRWAFAIARQQRAETRQMSTLLVHAAELAEAVDGPEHLVKPLAHRWLAMSELGDLILGIDQEGAAREDLAALNAYTHAEDVIRKLDAQWLNLKDLAEALGATPQSAWNHLDRLVKLDIVDRVGAGSYRLSPRGRAVLELLKAQQSLVVSAPAPSWQAPSSWNRKRNEVSSPGGNTFLDRAPVKRVELQAC